MKLSRVSFTCVILLTCVTSCREQPASAPTESDLTAEAASTRSAETEGEALSRFDFAPMWHPVSRFQPPSDTETTPLAISVYSIVWEPRWQEELGLSDQQKQQLAAFKAKVTAATEERAEQFNKLSPEEQQAQRESEAGRPSPWRRQVKRAVCLQLEQVLTPQQFQTVKDYLFPRDVVYLLYDAKVRQEIGFSPEQEDRLCRLARDRLSLFQAVSIEQAEKLWTMLTPQQQAAIPEAVTYQGGPSMIWELGFFELDNVVPGHLMLSEEPVRNRLGLTAEQDDRLRAITRDYATKKRELIEERTSAKSQASQRNPQMEEDALYSRAKQQVESVLTPRQLRSLNAINYRRMVALALECTENRKAVGITWQQDAYIRRLDGQTHQREYEIDCTMLTQVVEILTPDQHPKLRETIDRRNRGETETQ